MCESSGGGGGKHVELEQIGTSSAVIENEMSNVNWLLKLGRAQKTSLCVNITYGM